MKGKFLKLLCLAGVLSFAMPVGGYCYNEGLLLERMQKSAQREGYLVNEIKKSKEIEVIDGIYGVYPFGYGSEIYVCRGEDDNHIAIEIGVYRLSTFYINDIEITKNENGKITGTKTLSREELYIIEGCPCEDLGKIKVDIIYKDNELELKFNRDINGSIRGMGIAQERTIKVEKVLSITEQGKRTAINNILDSDFKDINQDIFEIIHDTQNYLVVVVKCHVGYSPENYPEVGRYRYYNIDKKSKKILELDDIILNVDDLNKYIIDSIEARRDIWIEEGRDNYECFSGIGKNNYFEVDEDRNVVRIGCLRYPCEANRGIGDLRLDVPFSFFKLNGVEKKDIDILKDNLLFNAIKNNDLEKVKELIENGANVNAVDNYDRSTPLHKVSDVEIARLLIENGADVNAKGGWKDETPLQTCMEGKLEIAEVLIENGADVNVKTGAGDTLG